MVSVEGKWMIKIRLTIYKAQHAFFTAPGADRQGWVRGHGVCKFDRDGKIWDSTRIIGMLSSRGGDSLLSIIIVRVACLITVIEVAQVCGSILGWTRWM